MTELVQRFRLAFVGWHAALLFVAVVDGRPSGFAVNVAFLAFNVVVYRHERRRRA